MSEKCLNVVIHKNEKGESWAKFDKESIGGSVLLLPKGTKENSWNFYVPGDTYPQTKSRIQSSGISIVESETHVDGEHWIDRLPDATESVRKSRASVVNAILGKAGTDTNDNFRHEVDSDHFVEDSCEVDDDEEGSEETEVDVEEEVRMVQVHSEVVPAPSREATESETERQGCQETNGNDTPWYGKATFEISANPSCCCDEYVPAYNRRYPTENIKIENKNGHWFAVSTNGKSISIQEITATEDIPEDVSFIVNRKLFSKGTVRISTEDAGITWKSQTAPMKKRGEWKCLKTENSDAKFPLWHELFPAERDKENEFEISLDAGALKNIADSISSDGRVRLRFLTADEHEGKPICVSSEFGIGLLMPLAEPGVGETSTIDRYDEVESRIVEQKS